MHTRKRPRQGSLVLAGLLLKTGAYGLMRFVIPLFPTAAAEIAPLAMGLGALGIVYGAVQAFAQTDFKKTCRLHQRESHGFHYVGCVCLQCALPCREW